MTVTLTLAAPLAAVADPRLAVASSRAGASGPAQAGDGAVDAALMRRLADGDDAALARLVERHQAPLVRYLARLAGSRERGEDLAQEAFLRLWHAAPRYRERERLLPYLYRIGLNLLRSEERRRTRWRLLSPLLGVAVPASAPDEDVLAGERQRAVARAVAALPLRFRVPLLLHEVEDWPCAAIAEHLGCREATVRTRLHRGRARLRAALAPYLAEGDDGVLLPSPDGASR